MALEVDFSDPPPWVVHVTFQEGGKSIPATWPFQAEDEARGAYAMAVLSGHFKHTLKAATKKKPAVEVNLVSLWYRLDDHPTLMYRMVQVPEEAA